MENKFIKIFGAKENNLKNIDLTIEKNKLIVITGPSGSGKSSLALSVLYKEGKRRYIESLSSYARQFLGIPQKPNVDKIEGLSPAIAIEQKTISNNPRSTVGTITEIYDYLRLLFARIGKAICPNCNIEVSKMNSDIIVKNIFNKFNYQLITILSPIAINKKGTFIKDLEKLFKDGYTKFIIDNQYYKFKSLNEILNLKLKKTEKHNIEIIIDSFELLEDEQNRLQDSIDKGLLLSNNIIKISTEKENCIYSSSNACYQCGYSFKTIEPSLFSFNSSNGACIQCDGLGFIIQNKVDYANREEFYFKNVNRYIKNDLDILTEILDNKLENICNNCKGQRLNIDALSIKIENKNIADLSKMQVKDLLTFIQDTIANKIELSYLNNLINELILRIGFLNDVGLGYLSLNRYSGTLSGGEGQRIRLSSQLGSSLSGVLYILDEPSIGLHQRDNDRLIQTLYKLRDLGNTVIVVEHDIDTILSADNVIEIGPGAGKYGGYILAQDTPNNLKENINSDIGQYLSGKKEIKIPKEYRKTEKFLKLKNLNKNNLKNIDVSFPLSTFCVVSGVSGSGKSTLVIDELVEKVKNYFNKDLNSKNIEKYNIEGIENISNIAIIDQHPIGRTPKSTPATYTGIMDNIRKIFAELPESKINGYDVGRFSYNVDSGRCSKCLGEGIVIITMQFMADIELVCDICNGGRYNQQTCKVLLKGKSIADILKMNVEEALNFFEPYKNIYRKLEILYKVGLGYIEIGQSSLTLSGGEAQRIKLAYELSKRGSNMLYILDEPTTGLSISDIEKLLLVFNELVDKGNSLIVIEHNLDVLKSADYIIDMGPEGGKNGGFIVAEGTPYDIAANKNSITGQYLKKILKYNKK